MAKIVFIAEVQDFINSMPNRAARKRVESHFNNALKKNASRARQLTELEDVKKEIASRNLSVPTRPASELATRRELT